MHALDEKNALTQELEKTRKYADELLQEKADILKELAKWRMETEQVDFVVVTIYKYLLIYYSLLSPNF